MRIFFARGESRTDLNDLFSAAATSNISTRSDKGDTPYNLRNCAYWGDFARPKIVWEIIGSRLAFTIDEKKYIVNNACYIMTGEHLPHILAFLNSAPLIWFSEVTNMNKTGVGDAQVGAQNIILFPIPKYEEKYEYLTELVNSLLLEPDNKYKKEQLAQAVYRIFNFSEEEVDYLEKLNL